jgi:hypothetical protein
MRLPRFARNDKKKRAQNDEGTTRREQGHGTLRSAPFIVYFISRLADTATVTDPSSSH